MTPIKIIVNVLDDEEAILIGVKDLLSDHPELEVQCYANVDKFLYELDQKTDLVITDVRLNQGYDIEQILSKIKFKNTNCYIIAMSAYMDIDLAERFSMYGIRWVKKDTVNWMDKLRQNFEIIYPSLKLRAENKDLFKK